jgi:hypothetical protein
MKKLFFIAVMLSSLTVLAQSTTGSLRQALTNNKALLEMSAPKLLNVNGFKETYSYTLTLQDVFFGTGGSTKFALVLASNPGSIANVISLTFVGLYGDLRPAIANTQHLVMMAGLCLGATTDTMTTLNEPDGLLSVLVKSLERHDLGALEKTYDGVLYTLHNMGFGQDQTQNELVKYSLTLQFKGQNGSIPSCLVKDEQLLR